jgi:hypothetical protein
VQQGGGTAEVQLVCHDAERAQLALRDFHMCLRATTSSSDGSPVERIGSHLTR